MAVSGGTGRRAVAVGTVGLRPVVALGPVTLRSVALGTRTFPPLGAVRAEPAEVVRREQVAIVALARIGAKVEVPAAAVARIGVALALGTIAPVATAAALRLRPVATGRLVTALVPLVALLFGFVVR